LTFLNRTSTWTRRAAGALANQHQDSRWLFGVGAVTASAVWFVSLDSRPPPGRPLRDPVDLALLDGFIAVMMIALGASLVIS